MSFCQNNPPEALLWRLRTLNKTHYSSASPRQCKAEIIGGWGDGGSCSSYLLWQSVWWGWVSFNWWNIHLYYTGAVEVACVKFIGSVSVLLAPASLPAIISQRGNDWIALSGFSVVSGELLHKERREAVSCNRPGIVCTTFLEDTQDESWSSLMDAGLKGAGGALTPASKSNTDYIYLKGWNESKIKCPPSLVEHWLHKVPLKVSGEPQIGFLVVFWGK